MLSATRYLVEKEEQAVSRGVTRSQGGQSALYILPHDAVAMGEFLAPAIARVDPALPELQLLVVTVDADSAMAVSLAALALPGGAEISILPITSERRVARVMAQRPVVAVAGAPADLLALVKRSSLKLTSLRAVVLAWADDLVASGAEGDLETLLADLPRESARVLVAGQMTAAVKALSERYLKRPQIHGAADPIAELAPLPVSFVTVAPAARPAMLQRLLDDLDPASAVVYVRSPGAEVDVRASLHALGYPPEGSDITVTTGGETPSTELLLLYEMPATAEELRELAASGSKRIVALSRPRELPRLRALAGGPVSPLVPTEAATKARRREEEVRGELRARLAMGVPARQVLALEPLLAEYDAVEIAAAALLLLERERERPAAGAATESAAAPRWTNIFMTVGSRDNVTPGDIVGAITAEAKITSSDIGKIDLRENHSLVEITSSMAESVVERFSGTMVRGRRVVARLERDRSDSPPPARRPRPEGGGRDGGGRDGGGRDGGGRDERPRRDFARTDRPRDDRPREDRPRRDFARDDRPRADRGSEDRPRRDFSRDDRPRSGPPRGERPRSDRPRSDRPPTDRPRSDRPRRD
jgi:hypothetical protein